jgi:hypothetical protein
METERQADKETKRQKDRNTKRQKDKEAERQITTCQWSIEQNLIHI